MREDVKRRDVEDEILVGEQVDEAQPPAVQRFAGALESSGHLRVGEIDGLGGRTAMREQHAGLLEALTDGRDPKSQAARRPSEQAARVGVGTAGRAGFDFGEPIVGIDRTTREDVGTADEVGVEAPAQHEHVQVGSVTHQHHGGRVPCRHHGTVTAIHCDACDLLDAPQDLMHQLYVLPARIRLGPENNPAGRTLTS
jgi:hypothetical protein